MTKISQLSDIGASLAGGDEFVIRDVSDATTPNKKVTSSGIIDYVIGTGSVTGFTKISAGAGPLSEVACTFSGSTGKITATSSNFTIDSNGRVGIGPTVPQSLLHLGSSSGDIPIPTENFATIRAGGYASPSTAGIQLAGGYGDTGTTGAFNIKAIANGSGGFVGTNALAITTTTAFAGVETERLRIDSSGGLLVGTSSARISTGGAVPQMQLEGLGFAASSVSLTNNSNDSPGSYIFLTKTRGGSIGSNVIVQNNDILGGLYFVAADGVDTQTAAAYIQGEVDGTPSADDMPGRLVFSTTADGASSPTARFTINSIGYLSYNDKTLGLYNLAQTTYNAASNATIGVFGASNNDSVNNGSVYNIELKMSGNANGQFLYANYITSGGSRTLGAYCTGTAWTNSSDIANKEEIDDIQYGLNTVLAMRPVDFRWKSQRDSDGNGRPDIGFIAQEMETLVPEVVTGQEGSKGISYGNLVAVLTKAIQEQQTMITELQAKVAALEGA